MLDTRRRLFGVKLLAILLLVTTLAAQQQPTVSLVAIISNPERYDEKELVVSGFLYLQREYPALYIGKADFQHAQFKNAIYLSMTSHVFERSYALNGCYVVVKGRFDAKNTGHLNAFSGALSVAQVTAVWKSTVPKADTDASDPAACK